MLMNMMEMFGTVSMPTIRPDNLDLPVEWRSYGL